MAFFAKAYQLAWEDRRAADRVEVTFRASKSDKRLGVIVKRTRVPVRTGKGRVGGVKSNGALEILLDLLDIYHQLSGSAPLMQTHGNRVEGCHAHGSNKGLEEDGRQLG